MRKFTIELEDKSKVLLTEHDLVNSGGEGEIFIKDNFAYKIYFDPSKMISLDKIKELSLLDRPNIVRPIQAIKNESGDYVGYQMNAIFPDQCFPLTRFFTTDFREKHGVTSDHITHIVKEMYETFDFIHDKDFLIVDGNEMNFLISDDFKNIYFIDVDSYKTPSFNPTAFNPNTLDPLADKTKFTKETDWYIFAILFTQIVLGIHPFKGKYTGTSLSFGKRDLTKRMKEGVSVLHPKVKLNKAVRSVSLIPSAMKEWLNDVFTNKTRLKPPLLKKMALDISKIVDKFNTPNGFKVFEKKEMNFDFDELSIIGDNVIFKKDLKYRNSEGSVLSSSANTPFLIDGQLAFAKLESNSLSIYVPSMNKIEKVLTNIDKLYSFNNTLYVYKNNKLSMLDIMLTSNKIIAGISSTWDLYHHQKVNDFILFYQSGKRKAYYFYEEGKNAIIDIDSILKASEKVLDIKGFHQYIVLKSVKDGVYYTKIITMDLFNKNLNIVKEEDADSLEINFVNNKGLLIGEMSENTLLIGILKKEGFSSKVVADYTLNKKLFIYKEGISFIDESKIYQLTMKS